MSDNRDFDWPHKKPQPWYNDSDKVAGLAATIVLLTILVCLCLGLIALTIRWVF